MENRFLNLFIREPHFLIRAVLILLAVCFLIFLERSSLARQKKIEDIKIMGRSIEEIPKLEAKLAELQKSTIPVQVDKNEQINCTLQGIVGTENDRIALISCGFYRQGDDLGPYMIGRIEQNAVILQDKTTKETRTIYITEEEVVK